MSKKTILTLAWLAAVLTFSTITFATKAIGGGFDPTPVQQFGLSGSWLYRLEPEGPIIAGNGIILEVSYNEFNQPILLAYWFRVTDITLGPTKGGGTLMLSWSGVGPFVESNRVNPLVFLTADSSCQVNEPCGAFDVLGSAEFGFHSCTSATMLLEFHLKEEILLQTLYLSRLTEPQQCGAQ